MLFGERPNIMFAGDIDRGDFARLRGYFNPKPTLAC
jgi:hypothetical protein